MVLFECSNLNFILRIVAYLFKIIQWIVPIILIVLVTFDLLKGMIGGDEKKSKEASSKAVKRLLYAVILFLVPLLVRFIFREVARISPSGFGGETSATSWIDCFNNALNSV